MAADLPPSYHPTEHIHKDCNIDAASFEEVSLLRRGQFNQVEAFFGCPVPGYAERLIRTLKAEEVYLNDYENIHEVSVRIGQFITNVYNQNAHIRR